MIEVPAFKAGFRVVPVAGAGVLLLAEDCCNLLRGEIYEKIAPLIDGVRCSDDIVAAATDVGLDVSLAWLALMRLESAGHLTESQPEVNPEIAAFWDGVGLDARDALQTLHSSRARVFPVGVGSSVAGRFSEALREFGVSVPQSADGCAVGSDCLDIVLTDDYLSDALLPFDEAARNLGGHRWLLVRPSGFEILVGPLFEPGNAGCLHCLRHKLERYRVSHRFAAIHDPSCGTSTPLSAVSATTQIACWLAALEAAKVLAGAESTLSGTVLSFDLRGRSTSLHQLIKRPNCPACGSSSTKEAVPLRLQESQPVVFNADGGCRTVPPEETLKTYSHLLSPITGISEGFISVMDGKGVGDLYFPASGEVSDLRIGKLGQFEIGYRNSAGKGMTSIQARTSALSETIERYSGEFQETDMRIPGSLRELGTDAIHPNDVMNFSDSQYRDRESWNNSTQNWNKVPEPFDPDARVDWTPLWSLTHHRHKLLPTQLLFYYNPWLGQPVGGEGRHCVVCSNGCASGNTLEEAVLQGFLELIERDAVAMWWYNRLRRPAIDLFSFGDPWLSQLADRYDEWGRDIVALDLTNDLGIPVVVGVSHARNGVSHARNGERQCIAIGFGCHIDIRIAVQRAMTEINQILYAMLWDDTHHDEFAYWVEAVDITSDPQLLPDPAVLRTLSDFPSRRIDDISECIRICRRSVEERGMEVLVLDQTRSDAGMPTVKVVVPGLRHFWPRFAPGRLYDVPVEMGMIETPTPESDLNPVSMIL